MNIHIGNCSCHACFNRFCTRRNEREQDILWWNKKSVYAPSPSRSYLVLSRSAILILIISQRSSDRRNHILFNCKIKILTLKRVDNFKSVCLRLFLEPTTLESEQLVYGVETGEGEEAPCSCHANLAVLTPSIWFDFLLFSQTNAMGFWHLGWIDPVYHNIYLVLIRNHQKNKTSQLFSGWEKIWSSKIKCEVCSSWPTNIIWEQFTSEIGLEVPFLTPVKPTGQMLVLRLFMSYHPLKWSERLLLVSNAQPLRPTDCDKGGCSIPVMWARERSTLQMKYQK